MKDSDIIKMKRAMFWTLKSNPRISYTEDIATVIHMGSHIAEVMWPNGKLDRIDKDLFEVVS
jgi:hypothetical protein